MKKCFLFLVLVNGVFSSTSFSAGSCSPEDLARLGKLLNKINVELELGELHKVYFKNNGEPFFLPMLFLGKNKDGKYVFEYKNKQYFIEEGDFLAIHKISEAELKRDEEYLDRMWSHENDVDELLKIKFEDSEEENNQRVSLSGDPQIVKNMSSSEGSRIQKEILRGKVEKFLEHYSAQGLDIEYPVKIIFTDKVQGSYVLKEPKVDVFDGKKKILVYIASDASKLCWSCVDTDPIFHELSHVLFRQKLKNSNSGSEKSLILRSETLDEAFADTFAAHFNNNPEIAFTNGKGERVVIRNIQDLSSRGNAVTDRGNGLIDFVSSVAVPNAHGLGQIVSNALWKARDVVGLDKFSNDLQVIFQRVHNNGYLVDQKLLNINSDLARQYNKEIIAVEYALGVIKAKYFGSQYEDAITKHIDTLTFNFRLNTEQINYFANLAAFDDSDL